jgi:ATP-dependent helicase/nuclease subunit A
MTEPVPVPDFLAARQRINDFLDAVRSDLPRDEPEGGWDALQSLIRRGLRLRDVPGISRAARFAQLLSALDHEGGATYIRWGQKKSPEEQRARAIQEEFNERLRPEVVQPAVRAWREHSHSILMEVVVQAAETFRNRRWELGRLNFQDLLLRAAEMLRGNPEVRAYFQRRYTHLLLDEFQDTDPVQAEVMFYLTGEPLDEPDWQRLRPRPGSLFVVGDPKQSIYRFRRADIDMYNTVKRQIRQTGGRVIDLTSNFRSVGKICDWANQAFRGVFPPGDGTSTQAPYATLDATRPAGGGNAGVRKLSIGKVSGNNAASVALEEARKIARWVRQAIASGWKVEERDKDGKPKERRLEPRDVLIITPQKKHLGFYAAELEKAGLPYEITGGAAFQESEELHTVLPFLRVLTDPDDPVSLVAFLRGPLCGASDDQLFRFRRSGGRFCGLAPLPGGLDSDVRRAFDGAYDLLARSRECVDHLPPAAALDAIFELLGMLPAGLAKPLGDTRGGNLLKAIEIARHLAAQGASFVEVVEHIAKVMEDEASEYDREGLSLQPGRSDAVRVMNLHQAKGLESPVVFLADPLRYAEHPPSGYIDRSTSPPAGHYVVQTPAGHGRWTTLGLPLDWDQSQAKESAYQAEERDRQRYVAATRAMDLLVVGVYPEKPRAGFWSPLVTFLEDVEELDVPDGPLTGEERPVVAEKCQITLDAMSRSRDDLERRKTESRRPTYRIQAVTAVAKAAGTAEPVREDTGKGMSWGRVIHKALEAYARDAVGNPRQLVKNLLRQEERPASEADDVLRTIEGVRNSPIWGRMMKSGRRFMEVPFGVRADPAALGLEDAPPETLLSGVIDLVFLEGDRWVIVDYKTDALPEGTEPLVKLYAPQLRLYRKYWEEISHESVKETGLFFVENGEFVPV